MAVEMLPPAPPVWRLGDRRMRSTIAWRIAGKRGWRSIVSFFPPRLCERRCSRGAVRSLSALTNH